MDFDTFWKTYAEGSNSHRLAVATRYRRDIAQHAFDAGVAEGLRQAAEKEARKKSTGLVLNADPSKEPDAETGWRTLGG